MARDDHFPEIEDFVISKWLIMRQLLVLDEQNIFICGMFRIWREIIAKTEKLLHSHDNEIPTMQQNYFASAKAVKF